MSRSSTATAPASDAPPAEPLRLPVAPPAPTPVNDTRLVWVLLAVALLPRLVAFPFTDNLYGDAVVRTELAERWLREPHVITSFGDGAYQFGPLHLYVTALPLALGVDRTEAGRLVSLLFGMLTVLPLFALTRRLFDRRAAVVACLGFAAWGMHVQMSTTAGSEALATFLTVWALALFAQGWDEGQLAPLAGAAGVLNLACATRYDVWMLLPVLALLLLLQKGDRVATLTRALFFSLLCLPFPLAWMQGNELAHGNPFYPVAFISDFHRGWVADGVGRYGQVLYRLQNLFFWPGAALVTLSPLVAFFGMVGLWRTWKESPHDRWLVWVVLVPTAYFTFRSAVLLDFVPLARFCAVQLALLLPFVASGADALLGGRSRGLRHAVVGLTALLAVGLPLALGLWSWRNDAPLARSLRPVSPVSTNPVPVQQVAEYLRTQVAPAEGHVALDEDPGYMDVQIGFYSGLSEARLLRHRWGQDFDKKLAQARPDVLVLHREGRLAQRPEVQRTGEGLAWAGVQYAPVPGFEGPWQVYRRR